MNISIVGATGLVGRTMLRVLDERNLPVSSLRLLASERSAGSTIAFRGESYVVEALNEHTIPQNTIALFSAGGATSKQWAPVFAGRGNIVVDNSSAWRMDPDCPLVVPGVNDADVHSHKGIIANPNCSAIQLVLALKPLHDRYGLRRVVVSTYQSPSGAGQQGVDHLQAELAGTEPTSRISPHRIAYNTVFHTIGGLGESSDEETKTMRETRRIMHLADLPIAVTCVRVPTLGGHAEAVAVECEQPVDVDEARALLAAAPGVKVVDDPANNTYPTPQLSDGTDDVYIGRIRRDPSVQNGLLLWVVADNLRVGAATNAVRIVELLASA
jgi:aspartate-semialdehyde dehydrogenase